MTMPIPKPSSPFKIHWQHLSHSLKQGYSRLPLHWVLAVLIATHGIILLKASLPEVYVLLKTPTTSWLHLEDLHQLIDSLFIEVLFAVMLGAGLVTNAIGLVLRARTAWFMSLFLLLCNLSYDLFYSTGLISEKSVNSYLLAVIALLALYGRRFNQASVISGTLFDEPLFIVV